jgi:hypothetical protein
MSYTLQTLKCVLLLTYCAFVLETCLFVFVINLFKVGYEYVIL